MKVLRSPAEMHALRDELRGQPVTVGLVPTMGYLHEGHDSLLKAARADSDRVVMSLFVNPTQFKPGEDLSTYPRDEERDLAIASEAGVDFVYAPMPDAIYPEGFATKVEVEGLTEVLCGSETSRGPGHFAGVTTIVSQTAQRGRSRLRLLRPEGRPAGHGHPPHGRGSRVPHEDRDPADGSRARRARHEFPQRLPLARSRGNAPRRSGLPCSRPRRSSARTGSTPP